MQVWSIAIVIFIWNMHLRIWHYSLIGRAVIGMDAWNNFLIDYLKNYHQICFSMNFWWLKGVFFTQYNSTLNEPYLELVKLYSVFKNGKVITNQINNPLGREKKNLSSPTLQIWRCSSIDSYLINLSAFFKRSQGLTFLSPTFFFFLNLTSWMEKSGEILKQQNVWNVLFCVVTFLICYHWA